MLSAAPGHLASSGHLLDDAGGRAGRGGDQIRREITFPRAHTSDINTGSLFS